MKTIGQFSFQLIDWCEFGGQTRPGNCKVQTESLLCTVRIEHRTLEESLVLHQQEASYIRKEKYRPTTTPAAAPMSRSGYPPGF